MITKPSWPPACGGSGSDSTHGGGYYFDPSPLVEYRVDPSDPSKDNGGNLFIARKGDGTIGDRSLAEAARDKMLGVEVAEYDKTPLRMIMLQYIDAHSGKEVNTQQNRLWVRYQNPTTGQWSEGYHWVDTFEVDLTRIELGAHSVTELSDGTGLVRHVQKNTDDNARTASILNGLIDGMTDADISMNPDTHKLTLNCDKVVDHFKSTDGSIVIGVIESSDKKCKIDLKAGYAGIYDSLNTLKQNVTNPHHDHSMGFVRQGDIFDENGTVIGSIPQAYFFEGKAAFPQSWKWTPEPIQGVLPLFTKNNGTTTKAEVIKGIKKDAGITIDSNGLLSIEAGHAEVVVDNLTSDDGSIDIAVTDVQGKKKANIQTNKKKLRDNVQKALVGDESTGLPAIFHTEGTEAMTWSEKEHEGNKTVSCAFNERPMVAALVEAVDQDKSNIRLTQGDNGKLGIEGDFLGWFNSKEELPNTGVSPNQSYAYVFTRTLAGGIKDAPQLFRYARSDTQVGWRPDFQAGFIEVNAGQKIVNAYATHLKIEDDISRVNITEHDGISLKLGTNGIVDKGDGQKEQDWIKTIEVQSSSEPCQITGNTLKLNIPNATGSATGGTFLGMFDSQNDLLNFAVQHKDSLLPKQSMGMVRKESTGVVTQQKITLNYRIWIWQGSSASPLTDTEVRKDSNWVHTDTFRNGEQPIIWLGGRSAEFPNWSPEADTSFPANSHIGQIIQYDSTDITKKGTMVSVQKPGEGSQGVGWEYIPNQSNFVAGQGITITKQGTSMTFSATGSEAGGLTIAGKDIQGTDVTKSPKTLAFDSVFSLDDDQTSTDQLNVRLRHEGALLGIFDSQDALFAAALKHKGEFNKGLIVGYVASRTSNTSMGYKVYSWKGGGSVTTKPTDEQIKNPIYWDFTVFLPNKGTAIGVSNAVPTSNTFPLEAYTGQIIYCKSDTSYYYCEGTSWIKMLVDGSSNSIKLSWDEGSTGQPVVDKPINNIKLGSGFYVETDSSEPTKATLRHKGQNITWEKGQGQESLSITDVHGMKFKGAGFTIEQEGGDSQKIAKFTFTGTAGNITAKTQDSATESTVTGIVVDHHNAVIRDGKLHLQGVMVKNSDQGGADLGRMDNIKAGAGINISVESTSAGVKTAVIKATGGGGGGIDGITVTGVDTEGTAVVADHIRSIDFSKSVIEHATGQDTVTVHPAIKAKTENEAEHAHQHITQIDVVGDADLAHIEAGELTLNIQAPLATATDNNNLNEKYPPRQNNQRLGVTTSDGKMYYCADTAWETFAYKGMDIDVESLMRRFPEHLEKQTVYQEGSHKTLDYVAIDKSLTVSTLQLPEAIDGVLHNLRIQTDDQTDSEWIQIFYGTDGRTWKRVKKTDQSWAEWQQEGGLKDDCYSVLIMQNDKTYGQVYDLNYNLPLQIWQDPTANVNIEQETSGNTQVPCITVKRTGNYDITMNIHITGEISTHTGSQPTEIHLRVVKGSTTLKTVKMDVTADGSKRLRPVRGKLLNIRLEAGTKYQLTAGLNVIHDADKKTLGYDPFKNIVCIEPSNSQSKTGAAILQTLYDTMGALSFVNGNEIRVQPTSTQDPTVRVFGETYRTDLNTTEKPANG